MRQLYMIGSAHPSWRAGVGACCGTGRFLAGEYFHQTSAESEAEHDGWDRPESCHDFVRVDRSLSGEFYAWRGGAVLRTRPESWALLFGEEPLPGRYSRSGSSDRARRP